VNAAVEGVPRDQLVRSSAVVGVGTLLSRVTGLLRVALLAAALGKFTLADTYNLANTTPNIVYELVLGGVLSATLVPLFVDHLAHRDDRATSAVFTVALSVLAALTAVAMVCAPLIARLYSLDTSGAERSAQLHVMVVFTLCFLPQMLFYGFTALATALLNAHRRFVAAAFAPVVNNVVVIGILLVFLARTSSDAAWTDVTSIRDDIGLLLLLGVGTTIGIVAMALVLVPALRQTHVRLRPVFEWRHPAVRTMLRLSGWTIGYVATNQATLLFVLLLAKTGTAGDVSAYIYSYAFYQVPHGLLAVSIMTTMTPELARRVTANDDAGLRRDFALGFRYIVLLMLPASVLFVVLAQPMVGVLAFGNFSTHDAAVTADALQAFAVSLLPFSIYLFSLRAFYARHVTKTPFLLNLFENAINVVLAVALFSPLGVQGLALAWSGAYTAAAVVTLIVLVRVIGSLRDAGLVGAAARSAVASGVLALVAAPVAGAIGLDSPGRALTATVVAGTAGLAAYVGVLVALRSDDVASLLDTLRRRRASASGV
jgi:putative peptidoglycan lipid II flippase